MPLFFQRFEQSDSRGFAVQYCFPRRSHYSFSLNSRQICLFARAGLIYYLSAFVNPVVYSLASRRFRQELLRLVCRRHLRAEKLKWAAEGTSTHVGACNSARYVCAATGAHSTLHQCSSARVDVAVHSPSSTPTKSPSPSPARDPSAPPAETETTASTNGTESTLMSATTPTPTASDPTSSASPTAAAETASEPKCFLIGATNSSNRGSNRRALQTVPESFSRRDFERHSLNVSREKENTPQLVNRRSLTSIIEVPTHAGSFDKGSSPPPPAAAAMCPQSPQRPNVPTFSLTQPLSRGHQIQSANGNHPNPLVRPLPSHSPIAARVSSPAVFATSASSNVL